MEYYRIDVERCCRCCSRRTSRSRCSRTGAAASSAVAAVAAAWSPNDTSCETTSLTARNATRSCLETRVSHARCSSPPTIRSASSVTAGLTPVDVLHDCRACERSVSGAENGAGRPENRVERSGAVSGRCRKAMERSGARSGVSWSGNGAGSVGYRIGLERGAAFSPAPLRSHALHD